jgi:predicted O-methyltransferase YrrM
VDRRAPAVGFLNRDEVHILYNMALKFRGQPALEIGCWLGWSTCHLALAGVRLDVIDPVLERHDFYASVTASLDAAGVRDAVNLVSGFSPQKVHELAAQRKTKWSLFFIDGDHEAPHPIQDAIACAACAASDALLLFHDLVSPDVAQALDHLQDNGWNTKVYQTTQIMGAAWRGNVQPVEHVPDPSVAWPLPAHLRRHCVAG